MKEIFNRLRLHITLTSIFIIGLGLFFLLRPYEVIDIIAKIFGFVLLFSGASLAIGRLFDPFGRTLGVITGILIAAAGVWVMTNTVQAASVIPVMAGAVMIIHGFQNINLSFAGKGYNMGKWYILLILGILNILFGAICIVNAFSVVRLSFQLMGIMLIYDGISSMITVNRVRYYEKEYIDVDYREL